MKIVEEFEKIVGSIIDCCYGEEYYYFYSSHSDGGIYKMSIFDYNDHKLLISPWSGSAGRTVKAFKDDFLILGENNMEDLRYYDLKIESHFNVFVGGQIHDFEILSKESIVVFDTELGIYLINIFPNERTSKIIYQITWRGTFIRSAIDRESKILSVYTLSLTRSKGKISIYKVRNINLK